MSNCLRRLTPVFIAACLVAAAPEWASAQSVPAVNAASPTWIRDVDNPAQQPFAKRFYPSASSAATYTVPANKRLMITDVAAFSYGSTTVEDVAIYTTSAGVGSARVVPFTTNNHGLVYATSPVTIEADAKTTVTIAIDDASSTDNAGMNVDIHGYFVNHQ